MHSKQNSRQEHQPERHHDLDDSLDVWIGVGANRGDILETLDEAQRLLGRLSYKPLMMSSLYKSEPWGGIEQDTFINQVIYARVSSCKVSEFMREFMGDSQSNIQSEPTAHLNRSIALSLNVLRALLMIESMLGRDRAREVRWGPRSLDLDLLAAHRVTSPASVTYESEELTLPHPRLHLRRFVLAPWAELSPHLEVSADLGRVAELLERCADPCSLERVTRPLM